MCGIVGFQTVKKFDHKNVLHDMMNSIKHRGPDEQGVYFNTEKKYKTYLGHNRLSIIDIDNGHQPMVSEDEKYVVVFNGEIYNYLELRQKLIHEGYPCKSYSDTEVLLRLYIIYKEKCVDYLNGMFSFSIYDKQEDILFLCRDNFGIKPLYYYEGTDSFVFASEIKSILNYPTYEAKVNTLGLQQYLSFQLIIDDNTMFDDIKKLEPAHYIIVKDGRIVEKKEYWKLDYSSEEPKTKEYYAEELLLLLENSVNIQTRSDVPVGSYLSGGIDSSLITTLLSKNYSNNVETFTGSFEEEGFSEALYAKEVSQATGSKYNEIIITKDDFINNIQDIVYHMDEPAAGIGVFAQYMVSQFAAKKVKVVLGGQGGDELFNGYTRYYVAYLEECLKGSILETQDSEQHIVNLKSIITNLPMLKQYVPMLKKQFQNGLFDSMDQRYFNLIKRFDKNEGFFQKDLISDQNSEEIYSIYSNLFNRENIKNKSYINKMTHFDLKTLLPALLHVEDRVSMAFSLESRVPILDKRIAELAARIPPSIKFEDGRLKNMLIGISKNILPEKVVQRKDKMGFPVPFNTWLNDDKFRDFVLDILLSTSARERGIFNSDQIENLIYKEKTFSRNIWGALNIELWHNKFIDK